MCLNKLKTYVFSFVQLRAKKLSQLSFYKDIKTKNSYYLHLFIRAYTNYKKSVLVL